MLLQERIEELESGILNIKNNQVEVIGFLSPERLNDYMKKDPMFLFKRILSK